MYKLTPFTDVKAFNERAHSLLMEDEAANNLPLGLLNTMITSDKYQNPILLLVENEAGSVVGSFIMTPPHYLVSTLKVKNEDIHEIVKGLKIVCENRGFTFPGFIAEKELAFHLTHSWCHLTGDRYHVKMNQRVYQLDKVNDIPLSGGKMVPAGKEHVELLARWIIGFVEDTGELPLSQDEALYRAKDMIDNERYVFIWEVDGEPVSMARGARRTENG